MVQRKGPDILTPNTKPKKIQANQEKKNQPSDDQDKIRSDLKRKLKRARSIKRLSELENLEEHLGHQYVQPPRRSPSKAKQPAPRPPANSSPNYMKPTTSSDARSERSPVSFHDHTPVDTDKNKNRGAAMMKGNSSRSKAGSNPGKMLTRISSLKSTTKKRSATVLFPDVSASGRTCSSTLKDSKFPKELELCPGSTESHGTSTMEVCPFTYCSLNGHWHRPLPPLKSFISSRRRLLKTQKSIKLKRLPSSRRRSSWKIDKQSDEGNDAREDIPMIQDLDDDFFVEIYANPYEESTESTLDHRSSYYDDEDDGGDDQDDVDSEGFDELIMGCSDQVGAGTEILALYQCGSETSSDGGIDRMCEFTVSEKEVVAEFLEYIEDQETQAESLRYFIEWEDGGDQETMNSGYTGEDLADNEDYEALLEAIDTNRFENMTECSCDGTSFDGECECHSDENGYALSIPESCEKDFVERNAYHDPELELLGELLSSGFADQSSVNFPADSLDRNDGMSMDEVFCGVILLGLENGEAMEETDGKSNREAQKVGNYASMEEIEFLEQLFTEEGREQVGEDASQVKLEFEESVPFDETEDPNLSVENKPQEEHLDTVLAASEEAESVVAEASNDSGLSENDNVRIEEETQEIERGVREEDENDTSIELSSTLQVQVGKSAEANYPIRAKSLNKSEDSMKLSLDVTRRNLDEELDEKFKAFNLRSPNFLPVEPDPEAENVDLRHQEMDERKNAEDWMIDHALQEVVSKLAPARKKKVALIVEAIETVVHSPMQACS